MYMHDCYCVGQTHYVVVAKYDDGETVTSIKPYTEILDTIDMFDCYGDIEFYKVFVWKEDEMKFEELEIHEPWHDLNDRLFIKVTDKDGKIYFAGHGTDH